MRYLPKLLLVITVLLGIIVIPISIWLKTEHARNKVGDSLVQFISQETGYNVDIEQLQLSFPLNLQADKIVLHNKEEKIIFLEDFHISFMPMIFPTLGVSIGRVSASRVHIARMPVLSQTGNDAKEEVYIPGIRVNELRIYELTLGKQLTGLAEELILSVDGDMLLHGGRGDLKLAVNTEVVKSELDYLQKSKLGIAGSYNILKDNLTVSNINLESPLLTASGGMIADFASDDLSGSISYNSNILEKILSEAIGKITGQISGEIKLSGKTSLPHIINSGDISLKLPNEDFFRLPNLKWQSDIFLDVDNIYGSFNMKQAGIDADGEFIWQDSKFNLKSFKARGKNFTKIGSLVFDSNDMIMDGYVKVDGHDIKELSEFLPFFYNGDMKLKAVYKKSVNGKQGLSLQGAIGNISTKYAKGKLIDIDINFSDLWSQILDKSELRFKSLNVGSSTIKDIGIKANSENKHINFSSIIRTGQPYPLNLQMNGKINYIDNFDVTISAISGHVKRLMIQNTEAILLTFSKGQTIRANNIKIGDGNVDVNGIIDGQNIKADILLRDMPIRILPINMPDSLKKAIMIGKCSLSGKLTQPKLLTELKIDKINPYGVKELVKLEINSILEKSRAKIKADIYQENNVAAGFNFSMPVKFTLSPFMFVADDKKPLNINISVPKPFNILSLMPMPPGHRLRGMLQGKIDVAGNLNKPEVRGSMFLSNGRYSYKRYGIRFKNIGAEFIVSDNKILSRKIKTEDYFGNNLNGFGVITLKEKKPFDFNFTTDKFNLINSPYLHGEIAGDIAVKGDINQAKASGSFDLGPMEIKVPERIWQDIPVLNVTKETRGESEEIYSRKKDPYKLLLDIAVKTRDRVFVRGWGVDTLLKGNLKVTGLVDNPEIKGDLESVRGKYQEFGKILKVDKGKLTFDGHIPPSPYINIVALAKEDDTEIKLILSGSILNPKLDITSNPELSQEDALSMLLFGANSEDISTFQALQLATSMRRLSGTLGGFDLLGTGRAAIGVDNISFRKDQDDPTKNVIGVGKHLTDKVYLEVESGAEASGAKTKIEIEVTPKISVESINDQEGNNSLGVNWRFDY